MRETTAGITAYAADDDVDARRLQPRRHPLRRRPTPSGRRPALELPHPGPVVDPRISPDGTAVAFVSGRSLYVVATDGASDARPLAAGGRRAAVVGPGRLRRRRGARPRARPVVARRTALRCWPSTSTSRAVAIRWIADPAQPEREPRPHRYPAAGTANPVARLFRVDARRRSTEIEWDHEAYPYLATVQPDDDGGAVISVLSRDQRRQLILDLSADGGVRTAGRAHLHAVDHDAGRRAVPRRRTVSCSRSSPTPTTTASSSWRTAFR